MARRRVSSSLILIAAFALSMSAVRSTRAGTCGDYLEHAREHKASRSGFPVAETDASLPISPKPCHGPRCSQAPVQPAQAPVTTPSTPAPTRHSIALLSQNTVELVGIGFWLEAQTSVYRYCAAEEIFHPPRAV